MVGRGFFVMLLCFLLFVGVFFEQRFIDTTCVSLEQKISNLETSIQKNDLTESKTQCKELTKFWNEKEAILSLLVDFKDIEKIGSQLTLVFSHLENEDFKLAFVEANVLMHVVRIFYSTVSFDFQNII